MRDTQLRRLIILQSLPRYPKKISTRQLLDMLISQGINTNIRAVQRDLEFISSTGLFGIGADADTKPAGWFWIKEANGLQLAFMDVNTAIAFELMRVQSEKLLPKSVREHIEPCFNQAEQLLKSRPHWNQKIIHTKRSVSALPDIEPNDRDTIFEALDKGLCISASLGDFIENKISFKLVQLIHPLGLMVSEHRTFLVFTMFSAKKVFSAPLHRIKDVALLSQKSIPPSGFNLAQYANSDPLRRSYKRNIELCIEITAAIANYLTENPLAASQTITAIEKNVFRLNAILDDTDKLRTALRSFGNSVIVISPKNLQTL